MGLHLRGTVSLDGAGFERGLHAIGHKATHTLKEFAIGAFGLYGIEAAIHKTISAAEELVNTSRRLGIPVEELQVLQQAAKEAGTDMDALASAFERLDVARGKIFRGDKNKAKLLQAFASLGVSQDMLKTQTAAQLFAGPISEKVRGGNAEAMASQLRDIFGKGFGKLVPMLKVPMDELETSMKKMGVIMSTETAVALKNVGEQLSLMGRILIVQLGPALVFAMEMFQRMVGFVQKLGNTIGMELGMKADPNAERIDALSKKVAAMTYGSMERNAETAPLLDELHKLTKPYYDALDEMNGEVDERLEETRKRLQQMAEDLKNPPSLNMVEDDPATKTRKKGMGSVTDSLVRVGNFLGSTPNAIDKIERQIQLSQQQVRLLEQIAKSVGGRMAYAGTIFPFM